MYKIIEKRLFPWDNLWVKVKSERGWWYLRHKRLIEGNSLEETAHYADTDYYKTEYEDIETFDQTTEFFKVKYQDKWGVISANGRNLIPPYLDKIDIIKISHPSLLYEEDTITETYFVGTRDRETEKGIITTYTLFTSSGCSLFNENENITSIQIAYKDSQYFLLYVKNIHNKYNVVNFCSRSQNRVLEVKECIYNKIEILPFKVDNQTVFYIEIDNIANPSQPLVGYLQCVGEFMYNLVPPIFNKLELLEQGDLRQYKSANGYWGIFRISPMTNTQVYSTFIEADHKLYGEKKELSRREMEIMKDMLFIPPFYNYTLKNGEFYNAYKPGYRSVIRKGNEYHRKIQTDCDIYKADGTHILSMVSNTICDSLMQELPNHTCKILCKGQKINAKIVVLHNKIAVLTETDDIVLLGNFDEVEPLSRPLYTAINEEGDPIFKVKRNGKYGLYASNKVVYPTLADQLNLLTSSSDTYNLKNLKGCLIKQDGKIGVVFFDGSFLTPGDYQCMEQINETEFIVKRHGLFLYRTTMRNIQSKEYYEIACLEFDALYPYFNNNVYGRIGGIVYEISRQIHTSLDNDEEFYYTYTLKEFPIIKDLSQGYTTANSENFKRDSSNCNLLELTSPY